MNLVDVLATGVRGATAGTAVLYTRDTTTAATVYADFAGNVRRWGTLSLGSSGDLEVYVNEAVDVLVYDSAGTLVRSFTEGSSDRCVEVDSLSFNGQDYTTSATAAGNPTTLEAVLGKVKTSFGSIDFNVLVGSTAVTATAGLAGLAGIYFNVKDATLYGALGDGATDDTVAIQRAADAAAVAGGVVFFPPGTYVISDWIYLAGNVSAMGSGANASIISVDNLSKDVAAHTGVFAIKGAGSHGSSVIEGLRLTSTFTTQTAGNVVGLIHTGLAAIGANALGCDLIVRDCRIGSESGATVVHGAGLWVGSNSAFSRVVVERCEFNSGGSDDTSFGRCIHSLEANGARIDVRECRFITKADTGSVGIVLVFGLCIHLRECFFDNLAFASGALYCNVTSGAAIAGTYVKNSMVCCYFSAELTGTLTQYLYGRLSTSADWYYEAGTFMDATVSSTATMAMYPLTQAAGAAWGTASYYCRRDSRHEYAEVTAPATQYIDATPGRAVGIQATDIAATTDVAGSFMRPIMDTTVIGDELIVYCFGYTAAGFIGGGNGFGAPGDYSSNTSGYRYALPGLDPSLNGDRFAYKLRFMRRPNVTASWLCTAIGGAIYGKYAVGALLRKSY